VTHGSGSGQIEETYIMSPLEAVCKELGVPVISNWLPYKSSCNEETGNCVTYNGLPRTNGAILGENEDDFNQEEA